MDVVASEAKQSQRINSLKQPFSLILSLRLLRRPDTIGTSSQRQDDITVINNKGRAPTVDPLSPAYY